MAHDLANQPHTGVQVMSCGDAHLSNFGLFASPERRQIFDLNDFDEASNATWEWDVKRLATSALIGGREASLRDDQTTDAARAVVRAYRETLMKLTAIERYYYRGESLWLEQVLDTETQ